MRGVTPTELAQVTGVKMPTLATRLNRARIAMREELEQPTGGKPWLHFLPVESFGRMPRFSAADAVRVAVAAAFEALGGAFSEGCRLAIQARVEDVLEHDGPDLFAYIISAPNGARFYRCGSSEIGASADAVARINVSAILRRLKAEAVRLDLTRALGWADDGGGGDGRGAAALAA